jgi:hypothetical protein
MAQRAGSCCNRGLKAGLEEQQEENVSQGKIARWTKGAERAGFGHIMVLAIHTVM